MIDQWWFLILLGIAVGTLGTLIGAGGGFILVPILLILMPKSNPVDITAISLAVVFCNATSGSIAYLRMGRVDLKSAAWFALATFPGAVVGALTTKLIPRREFNIVFGTLLVLASVYLVFKPEPVKDPNAEPSPRHTKRTIVDAEGTEHVYHFFMPLGIAVSLLVGFFSSVLGIGGGIIHVPVLNRTLNFPVHIATATSHAILSFVALTGTVVHFAEGNLNGHLATAGLIGLGAVAGAQGGARLSKRLHGSGIIRALAIALGLVGIRILLASITAR
jgi:uncharacterized membrane protein YfcA